VPVTLCSQQALLMVISILEGAYDLALVLALVERILPFTGTRNFLVLAILTGKALGGFPIAGTPAPGPPVTGITGQKVKVG
jgi:hypothetical protein